VSKRLKEFLAIVLIGDGAVGFLDPQRHSQLWCNGSETYRQLMGEFVVTYMDAWPYFAKRYGLSVLAVVQPANFDEQSAREVARIVDQLRQADVPAMFGSEIFASKVAEKIARETGVRFITPLYDEVLPGAPGEPQHSYSGMMQRNVATIVAGLGGDATVFEQCLQDGAVR
jgi:ABC-type Zn uptake system ZnuABC Zn-binding protein ZnuA